MGTKAFDLSLYAKKAREAAAEGIVMLRNEGGVLPLSEGERVALFGRAQFNYYKSGTGSGGMVNTRYVRSILDAMKDSSFQLNEELSAAYESWLADNPFDVGAGWAAEPWFQQEMPLSEELVRRVRDGSDTAVVVIGRTAGEDQDNRPEPGSYLLTEIEEDMLQKVCAAFDRTVVLLNVGNIIDMKWVERHKPQSVLYVWQGGQEGGDAVLDVLSGTVSPSGKLADTIAYDIADYPSTKNYGGEERNFYGEDIYVGYRYFETFAKEKVLYPFGYGLSYTQFALDGLALEDCGDLVRISVKVTNTGARSGKEVVQAYCAAPQGSLGKPARSLCAFAKTRLLAPGESEDVTLECSWRSLASYDDSGLTGHKSCFVLEAGDYAFYVGTDVRSASLAGKMELPETAVAERLEEACAPVPAFRRLRPAQREDGSFFESSEDVPTRTVEPSARRKGHLPKSRACTGDLGYKLADVEAGNVSMEEFLDQFSDEDLACIVRGEGMCSPKVTAGTAGAIGGVTQRLLDFGLPIACCSDGPSGIRMDCGTIAFAMPNGTCLACTFNEALSEELYHFEGLELRKNKIDLLLGPGFNIHRNPLNGRNFEYFSEDPLLSGKIACAQLKGMGHSGVTGCVKHFACNNQEHNRRSVESIVSERALREIYLRAFEIAVKEGGAQAIMSTYNPLNGFWTSSNYDLLTTILRGDWGYDGVVLTDWWAQGNDEGEIGSVENMAAMVRAQNDLYMVTADSQGNAQHDNSMESLEKGTVTRGEYLRNAANICRYLLRTQAWQRFKGIETELDRGLAECASQEAEESGKLLRAQVDGECGSIPIEEVDTAKGSATTIELFLKTRGKYRLEFSCRVPSQSSLAQVSMTLSQDRQILQTVSLSGEDKEWVRREVTLNPSFLNAVFLRFFFSQGGMELKDAKVTLLESWEENFHGES